MRSWQQWRTRFRSCCRSSCRSSRTRPPTLTRTRLTSLRLYMQQKSTRLATWMSFYVSGPKKQPKHKVFGRDIPGTSGTQTSGYPGQKTLCKWPFSVVFDREWPGCPGIWVGTSRIWKNFMQENFGLIFRTLMSGSHRGAYLF